MRRLRDSLWIGPAVAALGRLPDAELAEAAAAMSRTALEFADRGLALPAQRALLDAAAR